MKVIERYILRRVFVVFAAALFWSLAIVWTTQVLARIDLVTDSGQTALTFFEIATLMLPSIIPLVLPFALMIGVAQTLSTMNTDSELVVISAAGTPRSATIRPILLLAVIISIVSFAVDNGIDPYARERSRQQIAAARADLLSLVIQEGTFRKIEDGLFVQIGERLPDGNLGQIFVADSREENTDLIYYAKRGSVYEQDGKNMLLMFDGVINRKAPGGDVSVIYFTSYAFDLAQFTNAAGKFTMYPKDRTINYLLSPDPNDSIYKKHPQYFRAELHRRFTEWLYPIVFALIAIAVVGDAKSYREARIHPLITAAVIALIIRWLGFFTVDRLQNVRWFVWLVYGVPVVSTIVALWFIQTNRSMELPISWVDWLTNLTRRNTESFKRLRARIFRRPHARGRPGVMGWTLSRYFFNRYVAITIWFFLGILALIFLVSFTELAGRVAGVEGFSLPLTLAISALRTPMVMLQTVPFVALIAAMATLVSLNRKYELVIARSAGISAWQFLLPVCVGALVFGIASVTLLNPLAAYGFSRAEEMETDLRSGTSNEVSAFDAPWLRQKSSDGDTIIGARSVLKQGLELADAVFFNFDQDGNMVERLDAKRAYLQDGYWRLRNVVRYKGGERIGEERQVRLRTNLKPEVVQERLARPETIPIFQLPGKIELARAFGLRANPFSMQLHSLLALPVLMVAMTLIAATVSMRFARMGQSATMILGGIVAGFLLYVVSVLVKAFGNAGLMPPVIAAWFPVLVAMFFGVTFLLYKEDG